MWRWHVCKLHRHILWLGFTTCFLINLVSIVCSESVLTLCHVSYPDAPDTLKHHQTKSLNFPLRPPWPMHEAFPPASQTRTQQFPAYLRVCDVTHKPQDQVQETTGGTQLQMDINLRLLGKNWVCDPPLNPNLQTSWCFVTFESTVVSSAEVVWCWPSGNHCFSVLYYLYEHHLALPFWTTCFSGFCASPQTPCCYSSSSEEKKKTVNVTFNIPAATYLKPLRNLQGFICT